MSLVPSTSGDFKRPPSPSALAALRRRKKPKVLDEEDYVQKVEEIIERDFFPELDKMRAQSEYLTAVDKGDTGAMRRLEERYSAGVVPGTRAQSPATWETPLEEQREETEKGFTPVQEKETEKTTAPEEEEEKKKKKMTLDEFLARHTSEDNDSFNEIQEEQFAKFQMTHSWMFKDDEVKSIEMKAEQLVLPSIEHQASNERHQEKALSKPLEGWTYKNVNAVFYNPDGTPFTAAEEVERATKAREIVFENTRFKRNPWKGEVQKTTLQSSVYTKKEKEAGKVGADGKSNLKPETPQVNGFSLLRMASPSPLIHPSESPLMTWGEVESTPYRLEGCDTPLPMHTAGGPSFTIQDMPKRDRLAHELAEKNSKFYRDRKGKAIHKARCNIKSPKGSLTERVAGMSPAAQRLASSKLGIRIGTDKGLRAAYSPSPSRTPGTSSSRRNNSQRVLMGSSVRSGKGGGTPKTPVVIKSASTPSRAAAAAAALDTDDLLRLPSKSSAVTSEAARNRAKAADFL